MIDLVNVTVSGLQTQSMRLLIPSRGVWVADLDFLDVPALSGQVTIRAGNLSLVGTVIATESGTYGSQRRVRVVGGGGGWGTVLRPRAYHSDAGVSALTVAQDAAREAGETLGSTWSPASSTLDPDYVRSSGPASRTLEDAIGPGVLWWVDYAGVTQVGQRATSQADSTLYEVLFFDPRSRVLTLGLDDLTAVGIGSTLARGLDSPVTVRDLEIDVSAERIEVRAWCGGGTVASSALGRLEHAFEALVARDSDPRLYGPWLYRVISRSGSLLNLQAARVVDGLPDIMSIKMWPGVSGAYADVTPGAQVLVEFIGGQRSLPVVTHFGPTGSGGFVPVNVTLDATTLIKLGANATAFAARADRVATELGKVIAALGSATAPAGGGAVTYTSPYTVAGSVAASKAQVE